MAFGTGTINSIGGAVSDIFAGQATAAGLRLKAHGNRAEAENYDLAGGLADKNAKFAEISTAIKQAQTDRAIFRALGTEQSDIASAGFSNSGTALDLMRDSAAQGALTKAALAQQGLISEEGYKVQATSFRNMSAAALFAAQEEERQADKAVTNSYITAGIKGASAITSLFV